MAEMYEDLEALAVAEGVASAGTVLLGPKATVPEGAGPYIHIRDTSGAGFDDTHNQAGAYEWPSVQIVVTASTLAVATTKARQFYNVIVVKRNATVGSSFYLSLRPLQLPYDLGLDTSNRPQRVFNVLGHRRKPV